MKKIINSASCKLYFMPKSPFRKLDHKVHILLIGYIYGNTDSKAVAFLPEAPSTIITLKTSTYSLTLDWTGLQELYLVNSSKYWYIKINASICIFLDTYAKKDVI